MVAVDDFKFEVYPFVEDEGTVVDLLFGESCTSSPLRIEEQRKQTALKEREGNIQNRGMFYYFNMKTIRLVT